MIRALLVLFAVGIAGLAAAGIVFSVVVPLAALALKILFIVLIGYLVLRLLRPDVADDVKSRMKGSRPGSGP